MLDSIEVRTWIALAFPEEPRISDMSFVSPIDNFGITQFFGGPADPLDPPMFLYVRHSRAPIEFTVLELFRPALFRNHLSPV